MQIFTCFSTSLDYTYLTLWKKKSNFSYMDRSLGTNWDLEIIISRANDEIKPMMLVSRASIWNRGKWMGTNWIFLGKKVGLWCETWTRGSTICSLEARMIAVYIEILKVTEVKVRLCWLAKYREIFKNLNILFFQYSGKFEKPKVFAIFNFKKFVLRRKLIISGISLQRYRV